MLYVPVVFKYDGMFFETEVSRKFSLFYNLFIFFFLEIC